MVQGYYLSASDAADFRRMLNWWKQNRNLQPQPQIRRPIILDEGGRTTLHKAFCKENAGEGNTLACYLNEDKTEENNPEEITVHFNISPLGANLSDCIRELKDGDRIEVYKNSGEWWCIEGFQKIDSEQLQIDATDGLKTTIPECT
jgi:hypothetical protein